MDATAQSTQSTMSFESALDQLQRTVKKLESGELSLEDSLKCFEEGVRLSRFCQAYLSEADKRIEILTKSTAESIEASPFDPKKE